MICYVRGKCQYISYGHKCVCICLFIYVCPRLLKNKKAESASAGNLAYFILFPFFREEPVVEQNAILSILHRVFASHSIHNCNAGRKSFDIPIFFCCISISEKTDNNFQ